MRGAVRVASVVVSAVLLAALLAASWRWVIVHLSQETGTSNEASRGYAYWSGFGSVFPWSLGILAGLAAAYRHHNCHVAGCLRLGKPVEGTPYLACPRHHPSHHGHRRGVALELIHAAHRLNLFQAGFTTTASAQTFAPLTFTTTTKEPPPMSLFDDIEKRFTTDANRLLSDAETAARSHVGQVLLGAAKEIVPLLPEGREASLVVTKLEEVESWAHRALAAGAAATSSVSTAAAAPTEAAAVAAPDEATAPAGVPADADTPSDEGAPPAA